MTLAGSLKKAAISSMYLQKHPAVSLELRGRGFAKSGGESRETRESRRRRRRQDTEISILKLLELPDPRKRLFGDCRDGR
jgi:hypothetical protein